MNGVYYELSMAVFAIDALREQYLPCVIFLQRMNGHSLELFENWCLMGQALRTSTMQVALSKSLDLMHI
jgi:hypothetical protein